MKIEFKDFFTPDNFDNAFMRSFFWSVLLSLAVMMIVPHKRTPEGELYDIQPVGLIGTLLILFIWMYSLFNLWNCKCKN